jgi:hypothetical protein
MSATCTITIPASSDPAVYMLGTRDVAGPLRDRVETALAHDAARVCVDFRDVLVSHSFMDEFLGALILRHGPAALDRVVLRNCVADVQATAQLVAAVRLREFSGAQNVA